MNRLHARTRITLAMISIATTAMLVGSRLVPDYRDHVKEQRAAFCEAMAVSAQVAMQTSSIDNFRAVLNSCVDRDESLLSVGLRNSKQDRVIEIGDHFANWPTDLGKNSTDGFMQIPIYINKKDGTRRKPARLEMRFKQLHPTKFLPALMSHPWAKFLPFFSITAFFTYRWYLGRVFQQLDPERAVPQRVRSAYDFLAGGLVALDKNQKIVLANSAFIDIVGIAREDLLARDLASLAWIQTNNEPFPWTTVHQERNQEVRTHLRFSATNGSQRVLMVNASPVIGQDELYRGVLVSFEDITPLEYAKAELERSKNAAEAANVAKSAFLANMSHEIRTPMNAILGFAELMKRGFDLNSSDRQEYIEIIHSSGQHLLGLINDILDLSKVESGKMQLEWIDCQPHQLMHEVVSVLKARANEKNLDIKFSIEGSVPQTITADPLRLRQVLTNLAGNAIKFTEQGGVELVASTRVRQDGVPTIAFDVRDSGIGIAEDKLAGVFEPFSQADESTTRRFGGTGLGLSISRKLTELMGGMLTATSTLGQGSTFRAEIQLFAQPGVRMLSHDQACQELVSLNSESNVAVELPPGRVLVVDDGDSNRKLLQLILTRAGVTVKCATNGEEAVTAVLGDSFDVVLMDVQMPVMDGYTAMSLIRDAGYDQLPIVALTAHAMNEERERALASGFSHFLTKPVDIDALFTLIAELLGGEVVRKARPANALEDSVPNQTVQSEQVENPSVLDRPITCSLPMDDEEFRAICRDFVLRVRDELKAFSATLSRRDFDTLSKQAHWLKGAGGTAGFDVFTGPSKALEIAANENDAEGCHRHIREISDLTARIVVLDESEAVNS